MALLASQPFTGLDDGPFTFNRGKTYVHCSSAATSFTDVDELRC
jgi:hypothetical protein